MVVGDDVAAPPARHHRHVQQLRQSDEVVGAAGPEHAGPREDHRSLGAGEGVEHRPDIGRRRALGVRAHHRHPRALWQRFIEHILRERDERWAGPTLEHRADGVLERPRRRRGRVDPPRPLGEPADRGPEVHLLERLATAQAAQDVADEGEHGRRVGGGGVDADGEVGGAHSPRPEADGRTPGQLAVGLGSHGGGALVAGRDDADPRGVERVKHRQEALAGHGERQADARGAERGGDELGHGCRGGGRRLGLLLGLLAIVGGGWSGGQGCRIGRRATASPGRRTTVRRPALGAAGPGRRRDGIPGAPTGAARARVVSGSCTRPVRPPRRWAPARRRRRGRVRLSWGRARSGADLGARSRPRPRAASAGWSASGMVFSGPSTSGCIATSISPAGTAVRPAPGPV